MLPHQSLPQAISVGFSPVTAFVFVFVPGTTRKHTNASATALQRKRDRSTILLAALSSESGV